MTAVSRVAGLEYKTSLSFSVVQCCGSGYGIQDRVIFWPLDSGWVESQHPDPGSGDEQPGSYFLELRNHLFGFLGV
jgi:hypothetical protein